MSMGNRNAANWKLKQYLYLHGITYKMLAAVSNYSVNYLYKIMRYPLPEWQESVIRESADRIIKNTVPITDGTLADILKSERISYSEIAVHAGVTYSQIQNKLNGLTPLTAQWREIIEKAIKEIREERRLNYESV